MPSCRSAHQVAERIVSITLCQAHLQVIVVLLDIVVVGLLILVVILLLLLFAILWRCLQGHAAHSLHNDWWVIDCKCRQEISIRRTASWCCLQAASAAGHCSGHNTGSLQGFGELALAVGEETSLATEPSSSCLSSMLKIFVAPARIQQYDVHSRRTGPRSPRTGHHVQRRTPHTARDASSTSHAGQHQGGTHCLQRHLCWRAQRPPRRQAVPVVTPPLPMSCRGVSLLSRRGSRQFSRC
jgi:hypothetical protein